MVAIYREQVVSMAAMNSWCVKTRGMYTGKDGKFRFPVENLKGISLRRRDQARLLQRSQGIPPEDVWKKQGRKPIPIETYF